MRIRVTLQFGWSNEGLATFLTFVAQPICHVCLITLADAATATMTATATTQEAIALTPKDLNKTGITLY